MEDPAAEEMMGEDPMDEELYESLNKSVRVIDTPAVVKEVSRRVAKRLLAESRRDKLTTALAAKIAAKIG
jgi:hypothetical protein